jgi:hypothetical protein
MYSLFGNASGGIGAFIVASTSIAESSPGDASERGP